MGALPYHSADAASGLILQHVVAARPLMGKQEAEAGPILMAACGVIMVLHVGRMRLQMLCLQI